MALLPFAAMLDICRTLCFIGDGHRVSHQRVGELLDIFHSLEVPDILRPYASLVTVPAFTLRDIARDRFIAISEQSAVTYIGILVESVAVGAHLLQSLQHCVREILFGTCPVYRFVELRTAVDRHLHRVLGVILSVPFRAVESGLTKQSVYLVGIAVTPECKHRA